MRQVNSRMDIVKTFQVEVRSGDKSRLQSVYNTFLAYIINCIHSNREEGPASECKAGNVTEPALTRRGVQMSHHCVVSSVRSCSWKLGEYSGFRLPAAMASWTCLFHSVKRTSCPTLFLRFRGDISVCLTSPLAIAESTLGCCMATTCIQPPVSQLSTQKPSIGGHVAREL
jgi:hypothetical protein